jgi:hypothetical protein
MEIIFFVPCARKNDGVNSHIGASKFISFFAQATKIYIFFCTSQKPIRANLLIHYIKV